MKVINLENNFGALTNILEEVAEQESDARVSIHMISKNISNTTYAALKDLNFDYKNHELKVLGDAFEMEIEDVEEIIVDDEDGDTTLKIETEFEDVYIDIV